MLVLSRKAQQSIQIGESVKVTILRVKGNTVRIGVQAPDSVRIVRSELPDFNSPKGATPEMETIEEEIDLPVAPVVPRLRRFMSPERSQRCKSILRNLPALAPESNGSSPDAGTARPR